MSARVPTIDIGPFLEGRGAGKRGVTGQVDAAARNLGFVVIRGHGIDPRLIADMHRVSYRFFDLPAAENSKLALGLVSNYHGYVGVASEILSYSVDGAGERAGPAPDLKENFEIGRFGFPAALPAHDLGRAFRHEDRPHARHRRRSRLTGQGEGAGTALSCHGRAGLTAFQLNFFTSAVEVGAVHTFKPGHDEIWMGGRFHGAVSNARA